MTRLTEARQVGTLYANGDNAPAGDFRVRNGALKSHPADGMTADMSMGDGAVMTFINPQSFEDGGPEWACRYGSIESIRYTVAGLLESYDYLLSDAIDMKEAVRRLRLLRAGRRALSHKEGGS